MHFDCTSLVAQMVKNAFWVELYEIYNFGETNVFITLSRPIQEHAKILHLSGSSFTLCSSI